MLRIEHDAQTGWSDPEIVPFGKISMHPGAPSIQYGISLFEGQRREHQVVVYLESDYS